MKTEGKVERVRDHDCLQHMKGVSLFCLFFKLENVPNRRGLSVPGLFWAARVSN